LVLKLLVVLLGMAGLLLLGMRLPGSSTQAGVQQLAVAAKQQQ
jgi:hypothetical protein